MLIPKLIPVFALILFSKNVASFSFDVCKVSEPSDCQENAYEQKLYNLNFIDEKCNLLNSSCNLAIYPSIDEDLTFNFDEFNMVDRVDFIGDDLKPITLESKFTSDISDKLPSIYAKAQILIDSPNFQDDKTMVFYQTIFVDSISPKNPEKHLFFSNSDILDQLPMINDSLIYVYVMSICRVYLFKKLAAPLTINFYHLPIIRGNSAQKGIDVYVNCASGAVITYKKKKIQIVKPELFDVTICSNTENIMVCNEIHEDTIITVEEGLKENDILVPCCTTERDATGTIQGHWPYTKNINAISYVKGDILFNGFKARSYLEGRFNFNSSLFYLSDASADLIIENNTSLYVIGEEFSGKPERIGIRLSLPFGKYSQTVFNIKGKLSLCEIQSSNKNITVNIEAVEPVFRKDDDTMSYTEIDNSKYGFSHNDKIIPNLQNGAKVYLPYGFDKKAIFDQINSSFIDYIGRLWDKNDEIPKQINAFVKFLRHEFSTLSTIINKIKNEIQQVTVDIPESNDDLNKKYVLSIKRYDYPFTHFYQKNVNNPQKVLCVRKGKLNISDWIIKFPTEITQYFTYEYDHNEEYTGAYPDFENSIIPGTFYQSENCILFNQTGIPPSNFEFIIFTNDYSVEQSLKNYELPIVHTYPDATSRLHNKNSKNFIVFVTEDMDDFPVDLTGIRADANIFLIGFKLSRFDDIIQLINEIIENEKRPSIKIITEFLSKYEQYSVKASIKFQTAQTLFTAFITYTGKKIHCSKFIPFLSTFPNLKGFYAASTMTDSVTYSSISNLKFNNLILFPGTINPINLLSVKEISFTDKQWIMKFTSESSSPLTINTENINGQLYLYSLTSECTFVLPSKVTQVKGLSLISDFISPFETKDINGIFILEEQQSQFNIQKMKEIFSRLFSRSRVKRFSRINPKDVKTSIIKFDGNWDEVSTIDGTFEFDSGKNEMKLEGVPTKIVEKLDVKSEQNIEINTKGTNMHINELKVVSPNKKLAFPNENMQVSFDNLIFSGSNAHLTLSIGNQEKSPIVTNNVIVDSDTTANIDGTLTVKNGIELGPESSLSATSISTNDKINLTLNYRLSSNFANIPDINEPESIVLNYIGENKNIDDIYDYSSSEGQSLHIKQFGNDELCKNWLKKIQFDSKLYHEFRGNDKIVDASCNENHDLILTVNSIPTGDIDNPIIEPEFPSGDYFPDIDDSDDSDDKSSSKPVLPPDEYLPSDNQPNENPDNGDSGNNKKKLSTGAIVGIVIGVVAVLAIIGILIWFFVFHKKHSDESSTGEGIDDVN